MKYGLIFYKNTDNLGDDILSYAGKRFLPRIDYYIDRENMDRFLPEEKEYVAAVLNGWYIHYSYRFPPSPYLLPLFIGTHFNIDTQIYGDYSWLDDYAVNYLKRQEPVGCRDMRTMEILKQKGVESYFSGCLTLTLQKFPDVMPNHEVILTDVSREVTRYIRQLLGDRKIVSLTHRFTQQERGGEDWQRREERAESYLKRYQGADLVVTGRLHCALPCIALGTPVILVVKRDDDYYDRFECFAKYCTCCSEEEILSNKADEALLRPKENQRPDALILQMEETVRRFADHTEGTAMDVSHLPELSVYQDMYIDRSAGMSRAIEVLLQEKYQLLMQHQKDLETMEQVMSLAKRITGSGE